MSARAARPGRWRTAPASGGPSSPSSGRAPSSPSLAASGRPGPRAVPGAARRQRAAARAHRDRRCPCAPPRRGRARRRRSRTSVGAVRRRAVRRRCGRVHPRRPSAFNVLVDDGRIVLIDLPQVVDIVINPQGREFLARDCRNIASWFARRGVDADAAELEALVLGSRPDPATERARVSARRARPPGALDDRWSGRGTRRRDPHAGPAAAGVRQLDARGAGRRAGRCGRAITSVG